MSVCSRNPAHTARVEPTLKYFSASGTDPRRWVANVRASAHVFAGGTPIQDVLGDWPLSEVAPLVRATNRQRVPITFVGVGVESLHSEKSRRILAGQIIPGVRHWSVRSERDRERLMSVGASAASVTVAADMAWLIEPVSNAFGREQLGRLAVDCDRPLVAVNLVNENDIFDQQPLLVDELASALDRVILQMNARVIFLAQEIRKGPTFDSAAAARVRDRMRCADRAVLVPNVYYSPQELMSIMACCSLSISMRYHFCLLNALQGVPFIAIERTDKLSDLCWDLDWRAALKTSDIKARVLTDHIERLTQDSVPLGAELKRRARAMKDRSLRNVLALNPLRDGSVTRRAQFVGR